MPDGDPTPLMPPPAALLDQASLFLDFDGTLVEIADQPDAVAVDARLARLVETLLERLGGRIALVSGRPAEQVLALFGTGAPMVVGSHGMEYRWPDGRTARAPRPHGLTAALRAMRQWSQAVPGVLVEDKPLGAALHYRMAPEQEAACIALAEALAAEHGLHLQPGKRMVEVRSPGGDKGSAIRALMAEPRFAAGRPIFLGDDWTDEPGFAAAAALGGAGVLVGAHRHTDARFRLEGVADVRDWLGRTMGVPA